MTIPDGVEVPEELSDEEVDEEQLNAEMRTCTHKYENCGQKVCRAPQKIKARKCRGTFKN